MKKKQDTTLINNKVKYYKIKFINKSYIQKD